MSDPNIYLDGTGNFNALTKNAGTIKYGTFNNAASNTGVIAVSAIFTGTAVNSGVIGNILPINTANLVASNSAAWDSTYYTVSALSAEWSAGGGGGVGAADLTAISDVSATWDAAFTFVSLNSSILVDTNDSRLSDERTPAAHTQAISTIDGLQSALDAKQASGSYAAASHTHTSSDITGFASDVAALIDTAAGSSIASLVNGKVPSIQLPSYVDDVVEETSTNAFPASGETGKIYVATSTNKTYRWSGSTYVEISPSPGSTDAVVEGASNLYFTNERATTALQSTVAALSSAIDGKQASGSYASATDARITLVGTNSANWNAVYTTSNSNSASWSNAYTVVNTNSASWSSAGSSTPSFSSLTTGGVTLLSAMLSTFTAPVTASGDFIVITVGSKKRLIRLWDNT